LLVSTNIFFVSSALCILWGQMELQKEVKTKLAPIAC